MKNKQHLGFEAELQTLLFHRRICTYITEVGSVYLCQNDLRTVHNQREISKTFLGRLLVEPLQEESKDWDESQPKNNMTTAQRRTTVGLTHIVENLLGLPCFDVVDRVSGHPAAATDPFQICLVNALHRKHKRDF